MAKEKKFEEKISELEQIVSSLESGEIDLDDSIKKYTEAMKLVKQCDNELKKALDNVNKIVSENGTLENFEIEE